MISRDLFWQVEATGTYGTYKCSRESLVPWSCFLVLVMTLVRHLQFSFPLKTAEGVSFFSLNKTYQRVSRRIVNGGFEALLVFGSPLLSTVLASY